MGRKSNWNLTPPEQRQPISSYREERHPFGAANLPAEPPPGVMWVFEEKGEIVACNFLCPCGCGSSCYTLLRQDHPQHWEYRQGPHGPTLTPSIRYLGGCKSHFNISDGQVIMHADSGR